MEKEVGDLDDVAIDTHDLDRFPDFMLDFYNKRLRGMANLTPNEELEQLALEYRAKIHYIKTNTEGKQMISRWEDVVMKTAEELDMPYEEVKSLVETYALATQQKASHPKVMEIDVFGLGTFRANYSRLKPVIKHHENRIKAQKRYLERDLERGNLESAERCREYITLLEEDLAAFTAFMDIKLDFLNGKTRRDFEKAFIAENGYQEERVKRANARKKKAKKSTSTKTTRNLRGCRKPDQSETIPGAGDR